MKAIRPHLLSLSLSIITVGAALLHSAYGGPPESYRLDESNFAKSSKARGNWALADGGVSQSDTDSKRNLLLFGDSEWNDYSLTAKVKFSDPEREAASGLVAHASSASNYIAFTIERRKRGPYAVLRIHHEAVGDGMFGDQSWQKELDLSAWNELRLDVHGVDVIGYVNGKPAASFSFEGTPPAYNSHGVTWSPDPDHGRAGLLANNCATQFKDVAAEPLADFSHIVTPQRGRRDDNGKLSPRWPYAETMRRFTEWLIESPSTVDISQARSPNVVEGNIVSNVDVPQPLHTLPPYLVSNFVAVDDKIWAHGGEFAFNHAVLITGAVEYSLFSGDRRAIDLARDVADWHLANRTPSNWAFPHAPPSMVNYRNDGTWVGQDWGLEVDKSSYMGLAYLTLYAASGEEKYLDAANDIARTLRPFQAADGSWPFRINAQTGEVQHGYACSQLWHVWFFEKLASINNDQQDLQRSQRAFQWIIDNPVKTNKWQGLYGDISSGAESYDQWVALETIMYILDHQDRVPNALAVCQDLLHWVEQNLVVEYGFHPDVPGVLEQTSYPIVLTHHQLRLAEVYAKLYEYTRDDAYRLKAVQTANSVTWCTVSDGKIRQGFWFHAQACPLILCFNEQFCRIMSCIPETAPEAENHLLRHTALMRAVNYRENGVDYQTIGGGEERLKLTHKPTAVHGAGTQIANAGQLRTAKEGWHWNEEKKVLNVRHVGNDVQIAL